MATTLSSLSCFSPPLWRIWVAKRICRQNMAMVAAREYPPLSSSSFRNFRSSWSSEPHWQIFKVLSRAAPRYIFFSLSPSTYMKSELFYIVQESVSTIYLVISQTQNIPCHPSGSIICSFLDPGRYPWALFHWEYVMSELRLLTTEEPTGEGEEECRSNPRADLESTENHFRSILNQIPSLKCKILA